MPPPAFETCPDARPCGDGPRVPLLLISPYARSGAIVSDPGDHASFAKLVSIVFDLPPLASLPDEKPYLPKGPRDTNPAITDLLGGFDPARLAGTSPPDCGRTSPDSRQDGRHVSAADELPEPGDHAGGGARCNGDRHLPALRRGRVGRTKLGCCSLWPAADDRTDEGKADERPTDFQQPPRNWRAAKKRLR